MERNFNDSKYYKFLIRERREIDTLKWIESEKVGRDIGGNKAILLWVKRHRQKWIAGQS